MKGTEDNNTLSRDIATWSSRDIASFIHLSDAEALQAVYPEIGRIADVIDVCVRSIEAGGKVIYTGSGTSGRIAVQDVAELRPTFGIGNDMFDFVMAGGDKAIIESVEGAEDSLTASTEMLRNKNLGKGDVVIGITASGTTPFVIESLKYAKEIGAHAIALTNNQDRPISEAAEIAIEILSGPEVIQGSTRMKAGTTQKMVLNIISTAVAVKLGYTHKNTMVKMQSWFNQKLRKRAIKMLVDEFGISESEAKGTLEKYAYHVDDAFNYYDSKSE